MLSTIRKANQQDIQAITSIYNHVILHTTAVYRYDPVTLENRLEWLEAQEQAGYPVLVAVIDDQVAGFASYGPFRSSPAYLHTVEHSIHIDAQQRGQGIGRILLEKLIEQATLAKYHSMVAGIDAENKGSIEFHQRFGFKQVGYLPEVGFKFDRLLDLVLMQKMLQEK